MSDRALFAAGRLMLTPGAINKLREANERAQEFFARHLAGDWGEVSADVCRGNDEAIATGELLFSSYRLCTGECIYITTEADRSSTTMLLSKEYHDGNRA